MTEQRLQSECYIWFHNNYPHLRGLLFKVKNEGHNRITGARDKATGLVPGVSDMILLTPCRPIYPVFIEFKLPDGKLSKNQKNWKLLIESFGYSYEVVKSLETFQFIIRNHIDEK